MWLIPNFLRNTNNKLLANILSTQSSREDLLGMKASAMPSPDSIRKDAYKILKYTNEEGYKKFAEEAWAQVINGLDQILNPKASNETRNHFCGEVNATLNLLRLSYKAKYVVDEYDKETASLQQNKQG